MSVPPDPIIPRWDSVEDWVQRHWLSRWEMCEVVHELRRVAKSPPGISVVLEIGVHRGDSLRIWRELFDPELLIGIDNYPIFDDNSHLGGALDEQLLVERSQDEATRDAVLALLDGRPVDYLYIDGDHTYDAVKADWELYSPLVREGGIVVFHDATLRGNPTVEVYQFWPEIMEGRRTKLLHDGNPAYPSTGVGLVFV